MSDSTMTTDKWGNKIWRNSLGHFHRTDGPSIEYSDGSKEWYMDGKWHRINGPAIEWVNGDKWWYINDELLSENDEGFWALWDRLTPEQKEDTTLLSYLPGDFNV